MAKQRTIDPLEQAKAGSITSPSLQQVPQFTDTYLSPIDEPEIGVPTEAPPPPAKKSPGAQKYRVLESRKISCGPAMVQLHHGQIVSNSVNPELMRRIFEAKVRLEEVEG